MKKIGFLGPRGTFSQEALEEYAKGIPEYTPREFSSIAAMIMAVERREIDEGIAPIENSLEGAVNVTLDMMATEVDLKIKSEVIIPVSQNLLVKKDTDFQDIRHIISHTQAIGQCRKYIDTKFPGVEVRLVNSTAGAAEEVSKGEAGWAAIGSATAARVYGLDILDRNIQDEDNNVTRFIVVAKEDSLRTGTDKTSIVFSTDDKPGSLYRVLDIFNLWDINMTRIESRPAKNQLGRYIFFIDINGYKEDDNVKDALTMIRKKTSFFKFLGSYPRYERI